jgi:uncharacterized protein
MVDGYQSSVRELVWTPVRWPGCEHLVLRTGADRVVADGMVIAVPDGAPIRLHYRIECDASWRTYRVELAVHGQPPVSVTRRNDDRWFTADGTERNDLAGCVDVDIALTPFTNTLPIRRLDLAAGESAGLRMVYVTPGPAPEISTSDQRYTRISASEYRYQSGTFTADLPVDGDGIVTRYPDLWVLRQAGVSSAP